MSDKTLEAQAERAVVEGLDPSHYRKLMRRDAVFLQLLTPALRAGATRDQLTAMAKGLNRQASIPCTQAELGHTIRRVEEFTGGPIVGASEPLPFVTAQELFLAAPTTVEYVVRPYIPKGVKFEIYGAVKDGKTTFALYLAGRALTGTACLGYGAEPAVPVLYCTEQSTILEAIKEAGLHDTANLHLLPIHRVRDRRWPQLAARIIERAVEVGARLIFIDTFARWAGFKDDDENASGACMEALAPLDPAIGEGIAVGLVRHARKSGGDINAAARGSSAISGEMDVIISIKRGGKIDPKDYRVIETMGRVAEIPESLTIRLVANPPSPGVREWRRVDFELVDGDPDLSEPDRKTQQVVDALTKATGPLTRDQITKVTGIPDTTLRRILTDLEARGLAVTPKGGGERGTAMLYALGSTSRHDPTPGGGDLADSAYEETAANIVPESPEHDPGQRESRESTASLQGGSDEMEAD